MSIWNYLLIGICGIFRPSGNDLFTASEREIHSFGEGIKRSASEDLRKLIAEQRKPDMQRLCEDWNRVCGDINKAHEQTKIAFNIK